MVTVRIVSRAEDFDWDMYVASRNQGGPYLTPVWKNAVESAYGHRTFCLGAYQKNTLAGILPLVWIRFPMARGCLVSMPFCDYGGILADHGEASDALLRRAIALAGDLHSGLEIRSSIPSSIVEKNKGFFQITDKCRMVLELPGSSSVLWSGFQSKLRSQIKRAKSHGLVVRLGGEEMLNDFFRVFSQNMRDLGSPVHSRHWLKSIMTGFGKNAGAGVVYKDHSPVGAGIILMHNRTVTIPWASTRREFNRLGPNMLLYYTFLEYATDSGYRYFDFGRSTPGEGTYAFKKQWGAIPVPLAWYRFNANPNGKKALHPSAPMRNAMGKAWRRLPLNIANVLGPCIRKFIAK